MSRYLLIDGNNLAMRAVHASWNTSTLTNAEGVPTAAVMIYINSLTKLIGELEPTHVAIAWDGQSKFRRELLPSYKANRKEAPQELRKDDAFRLMQRFAYFAGIHSLQHVEHEADDVIAAWWGTITHPDSEIIIASGDKDLLQLLGPNPFGVCTLAYRFGDPELWSAERFEEVNGYEPERWPLVAALQGDASDNIEGVRGIGPKKAVKMLREHDWDLMKATRDRFPESASRVEVNFRLMDLQNPQEGLWVNSPPTFDPPPYGTESGELLDTFLTVLELAEIQARYRRHTLWTKPTTPGRALRPRVAEGRG
jgi:5'-3' exonuclease